MKLINCGDSWAWGYELIDPIIHPTPIAKLNGDPYKLHLEPVHQAYRFKHRYANILAQKLNAEVVDLSMTGSSNHAIIRKLIDFLISNGYTDKDKNKDIFVCIGWTSPVRTEFWIDKFGYFYNYGPWFDSSPFMRENTDIREALKQFTAYLHGEKKQVIDYYLQILTTERFLKSYNINYVMFQCFYNNEYELTHSDNFFDKVGHVGIQEYQIYNEVDNKRFLSKNQSLFHKFFSKNYNRYMFEKTHPNELGHQIIADFVYDSCKENNLI